jgi:AcrR family transcriptional regulator
METSSQAAGMAVPARRTQAQRRARTRGVLLDATLECLVAHGYGGTTTTAVAERADVSRGAQLHHFPTRADLVAAAIEHLFDRMREEYRAALSPAASAGGADAGAAVDLLWAMFEKPDFAAVLELYTAARTDGELRARLVPVADAHQAHVYRLAGEFFPRVDRAALDRVLRTILDAMQGMAVSRFVTGSLADRDARLAELKRLAREAVAPG